MAIIKKINKDILLSEFLSEFDLEKYNNFGDEEVRMMQSNPVIYDEKYINGAKKGMQIGMATQMMKPFKLTKKQKIKLLHLLNETNCDLNMYITDECLFKLKEDTN